LRQTKPGHRGKHINAGGGKDQNLQGNPVPGRTQSVSQFFFAKTPAGGRRGREKAHGEPREKLGAERG